MLGVTGGTFGIPVSLEVVDCLSDQYTTLKLLIDMGLDLELSTLSASSNRRGKPLTDFITLCLPVLKGVLSCEATAIGCGLALALMVLLHSLFLHAPIPYGVVPSLGCRLPAVVVASVSLDGLQEVSFLVCCKSLLFIKEGRVLF